VRGLSEAILLTCTKVKVGKGHCQPLSSEKMKENPMNIHMDKHPMKKLLT